MATLMMKEKMKHPWSLFKLTNHGTVHHFWSADLANSFSQCQYLSFFDIFLYRFFPVEKYGATPHCLYRDSITLL